MQETILNKNEYHRILRHYYYNQYPYRDYFRAWNKGEICSVDLEEDKIFNYSDFYYIKSMVVWKPFHGSSNKNLLKRYKIAWKFYTLERLSGITWIKVACILKKLKNWSKLTEILKHKATSNIYVYEGRRYTIKQISKLPTKPTEEIINFLKLGYIVKDIPNYECRDKKINNLVKKYWLVKKRVISRINSWISWDRVIAKDKLRRMCKNYYLYNGEKYSVIDLANISKISTSVIYSRIKLGWDMDKVMTTNIRNHIKRK